VFVGDRHQRLVIADASVGGNDPRCESRSSLRGDAQGGLQRRARPLHQQSPQIGTAAPGDTPQARLAAGGILSRVSPIHAANNRPQRNCCGSITVAAMALAVSSPTPLKRARPVAAAPVVPFTSRGIRWRWGAYNEAPFIGS
jgi:hypothetical protein